MKKMNRSGMWVTSHYDMMFSHLDQMHESGSPKIGYEKYLIETFDIPPHRAAEVVREWLRVPRRAEGK